MLKQAVHKFGEIPRACMVWMTIIAPVFVLLLLAAQTARPTPQARMFAAAQSGDVKTLASSLKDGGDIDQLDDTCFTPLMIAARAGQLDAVRQLLERGADLDINTPINGTALMQAALYGKTDVVNLLLAHHADVRVANAYQHTALDFALMSGSATPELIKILLKANGLKASAEQVESVRRAADTPRHWDAAGQTRTTPPSVDHPA